MASSSPTIPSETWERAYRDLDYRRVLRDAARKFRGTLSRDQVEECAQDALYYCLRTYRAGAGRKFTTCLHQCAIWKYLNAARKEGLFRRRHREFAAEPFRTPPDPRLEVAREGLSRLPEDERNLLEDHFLGGYSLREIGDREGRSRQGASWRARRAMERLRRLCGVSTPESNPQTTPGDD